MQRIKSFDINHNILEPGLYLSRIDGDVNSYDVRFYKPNCGTFFSTGAGHTLEHLFATYVRNSSFKDQIVYVGPMGCRTGFYLLTRNVLSEKEILKLVYDTFSWIADFKGEIPGRSKIECGNYLDHNLEEAVSIGKHYRDILSNWDVSKFTYLE